MRRDRLFLVIIFLLAIIVQCVLVFFEKATPHIKAVSVLTRYSPTRRPKRTWYLLTARATRLALFLSANLSALHCACAPTVDVERGPSHTGGWGQTVSSLLWGFLGIERVDGPSDLSLLQVRPRFDSRKCGLIWPSA